MDACSNQNIQVWLRLSRSPAGLWVVVLCLLLVLAGCASARKNPTPPPAIPTSATAGTTTIVAIAPPAPASCDVSLPKLLGLPQLAGGLGEAVRRIASRLSVGLDLTGRFPGLQPQPPLVPLTDPANLEEDAPPAVQAAAKIKAEEDAAPQKIMAIRYLATLGCGGCYEDVEQALLEAMSDCTEEVRFEAVKALQCRPDCGCRFCTSPSCCSPPVRKRLEELTTCEKEPSVRINRVARLALACCQTKPLASEDIPREGPTPAPTQDGQAASILAEEAGDPVALLFSGSQLVNYPWNANPSTSGAVQTASASQPTNEKILAMVNGEPILASHISALIDTKKKQLASRGQPVPDDQQLQSVELQRAIDWCLIHQLASNELSSVAPASAVTVAGMTTSMGPRLSASETQAWLARKLAVDTNVTPSELMAYYQIHQSEFSSPARMRWECLTILAAQCKSSDEVSQVAAYIKSKASGQNVNPPAGFQPTMVDVQVTDWQEIHQVPPRVQELLAGLQPGQISQPYQQDKGLSLLRLLAREASQPIPISSVAGKITQDLLKQRREAALQHFLATARAGAKIWSAAEVENKPAFNNSVLAH